MALLQSHYLLQAFFVPQDPVLRPRTERCRGIGRQLRRVADEFEAAKLRELKGARERSDARLYRIVFVATGAAVLGRILWRWIT